MDNKNNQQARNNKPVPPTTKTGAPAKMSFASAVSSNQSVKKQHIYNQFASHAIRMNFDRTHTSTSSATARANITYIQRGTHLSPNEPLFVLPNNITCHAALKSFFSPYFDGAQANTVNQKVTELFITTILGASIGAQAADYTMVKLNDHICVPSTKMTFQNDSTYKYLGDMLCEKCVLPKMINYMNTSFSNLIKRKSLVDSLYPTRILEKIAIGMFLQHTRALAGLHKYQPVEMKLYPTENAFKYALTKIPTEFGEIFTTEPCTNFTDLNIRSTGTYGGYDFCLHTFMLMNLFTHTFLVAGIEKINFSPIIGNSLGNASSYTFDRVFDMDDNGLKFVISPFNMPKSLISAYSGMRINACDVIPCISIVIDNVKYGGVNQYRSIIAEAICDAFTYILTKSVQDPNFATKFRIGNITKGNFINTGTIKVLGDGHSVGFGLYDQVLLKYDFTEEEFSSLINFYMIVYVHEYAMSKLKSRISDRECLTVSYMARIRNMAQQLRITDVTLKPNTVDIDGTTTEVSANRLPQTYTSEHKMEDIKMFNWADLMDEEEKSSNVLAERNFSLTESAATLCELIHSEIFKYTGCNAHARLDYNSVTLLPHLRVDNNKPRITANPQYNVASKRDFPSFTNKHKNMNHKNVHQSTGPNNQNDSGNETDNRRAKNVTLGAFIDAKKTPNKPPANDSKTTVTIVDIEDSP